MKLNPPKTQIKSRPTNVQRYVVRVHQVEKGSLLMTIWEWFGERRGFGRELFATITLGTTGISSKDKFHAGTPAEMWTWEEMVKGKKIDRIHIQSLD